MKSIYDNALSYNFTGQNQIFTLLTIYIYIINILILGD